MSERIHTLAQQLLRRSTVADCSLQEIRDLADSYPYFSAAQFLLLEKMKQTDAPGYSAQAQKAVLYYHDPLVFEFFISSDRFFTEPGIEDDLTDLSTTAPAQPQEPAIDALEIDHSPEEHSASTFPVTEHIEIQPEPEQPSDKPADEIVAFEPYHTVDYFASQGIKLSQEELPKDKFGKQLKSFTEWLRTMKKLPAKEAIKSLDTVTEQKVQHLAEDSVHDADVVTESMAEVWLKQGNKQKALEVYNKLSLLNPSKKAYFAAKIDHLK